MANRWGNNGNSERLFFVAPKSLWNREKESKMAVAKRQGREKPAKIEQRKVKGRSEDQSEDFRQNALLAKPYLHRTGPGGRKKNI